MSVRINFVNTFSQKVSMGSKPNLSHTILGHRTGSEKILVDVSFVIFTKSSFLYSNWQIIIIYAVYRLEKIISIIVCKNLVFEDLNPE